MDPANTYIMLQAGHDAIIIDTTVWSPVLLPESENPSFQTKTALRRMLDEAGISPRGRYGQNFLIDRNLMRKLTDAAELGSADCVLEVGAGTGSLTAMIAKAAGRVVAVEIDRELVRLAGERLSGLDHVILLRADALDNKSTVARDLYSAVRSAHTKTGGPLKMVANLPYDIATPLVVNLLLGARPQTPVARASRTCTTPVAPASRRCARPVARASRPCAHRRNGGATKALGHSPSHLPFSRFCFTVQQEVADRFLAEPDTAAYGPISIITRLLAAGRRICKVPPQSFWPAPRVHSTMIRLDVRPAAGIPIEDPPVFARFVRSFFQHRRKTIAHTARQLDAGGRILDAITQTNLPPEARPENLTVQHWTAFYQAAC